MSKESRKFQVPDALANLYDFANTLDVRHFTHFGVEHPESDALGGPKDLADWMRERGRQGRPCHARNVRDCAEDARSLACLSAA